MENHALILALFGICAGLMILGWHVRQGLQLKKRVDETYRAIKAMDKAFEERAMAQIRETSQQPARES